MGWVRFALVVPVCVLFCTGCVTQMQERAATPESGASGRPAVDDALGSAPAEKRIDRTTMDETPNPVELARRIESVLPDRYMVVAITPADPAVVIAPTPSLIASQRESSSEPLRSSEQLLLALVTDGNAIALFQRPFEGSPPPADASTLVELPVQGAVERYGPILLSADGTSGVPPAIADGMTAVVVENGGAETLFVIASRDDPYVLRTPLSSIHRSVLRDLDGDGLRELVQYSRVFEAGGKREVIVDSLRWTGTAFQYDRSLAVVRAINEELGRLAARLRAAQAGDRRFSGSLQPADDAPPATTVFPARAVVIPEFSELYVDLGMERWIIAHEIALEDNDGSVQVYRIHIEVEANPYRERPVTIVGLE